MKILVSLFAFITLMLACSLSVADTVSYNNCLTCLANGTSTVSGSAACSTQSFTEGTCQPVIGNSQQSISVTCSGSNTDTCGRFFLSLEGQTCSTLYSTASFKCGGCNMWGGQWIKFNCPTDVSQQEQVSWSMCTDSTCGSCTASPSATVYTIDNCQPLYKRSNMNTQIYGKLMDIGPCNTVNVSMYNSPNCASNTLADVENLGQNDCNRAGRFQCANQPTLITNNGPSVLASDYASHSVCSGPVIYGTTASGGCRWRATNISDMITCTGQTGTCARLMVFGSSGQFQNSMNHVCGKCIQLPFHPQSGSNTNNNALWTMVNCDPNSQSITFTESCTDSTCSSCSTTQTTYPYLINSQVPTYSNVSVINLGLSPCGIVRRQAFRSDSCDPATQLEDVYIGENMCSWGHVASCGNYNEQSATLGQCILNSDTPLYMTVTSGQCESGFQNQVTARVTCTNDMSSQCAVLHFWNRNSTSTSLIDQRTFICNSCYVDNRFPGSYRTGPLWVSCPNATSITLTPTYANTQYLQCTPQTLNQSAAVTYNLFEPKQMSVGLGTNFSTSFLPTLLLAGITRCDSARVDVWAGNSSQSQSCSDLSPTGNYAFGGTLGVAGCDVQCSNPIRPPTNTEANYDVLVHMCRPAFRPNPTDPNHGFSCTTKRHPGNNVCSQLDMEHGNGWSTQIVCGGVSKCAQILIFNTSANNNSCSYYTPAGSTGSQPYFSHWNVVCNTCFHSFAHGWTYITCDFAANNITLWRNCSDNCGGDGTVASANANFRKSCPSRFHIGWQGCSQDTGNFSGWAFRSLGVQACSTVHAQYWNNSQCSGTPTWDLISQEATRSAIGSVEFTCIPQGTAYTLPGGSVNYYPCNRGAGGSNTLQTGLAQATCLLNLKNLATPSSSMITCHANRVDQCVSMTMWTSPTCMNSFAGVNNVPCHSCFKTQDGSYAWVQCGSAGQNPWNDGAGGGRGSRGNWGIEDVSIKTGCDQGCNNCQNVINSEVLGQCASFGTNAPTLNNPLYVQLADIRPCSTAQYMEWNNNNCNGAPSIVTYVAQGECTSEVGNIMCSQQASLLPKPTNAQGANVRMSFCSGAGCTGVCTAHTVQPGTCIPLAVSIADQGQSIMTQCTGEVGQCAHLHWFINGHWKGMFSQVCGSCTAYPTGTTPANAYMKVTCFPNGTVQRAVGCDSACGTCQTIQFSDDAFRYSSLGDDSNSILNLGIFQCNIMQRTIFSGTACNGSIVVAGPLPEDACMGGATLSCGMYNDIETISRTNCSNPKAAAQTLVSAQCGPARFDNTFGEKLTCLHGASVCANLAVNVDPTDTTTCKHEMLYSAKCGSCLTAGPAGVPLRLDCNYDQSTITLSRCRDLHCSDCETELGSMTFYEGQCGISKNVDQVPIHGTFWGFTSCSVVRQQVYNGINANSTCSTDAMAYEIYSAQGACNGDTRIQCGSYIENVRPGLIDLHGRQTSFDVYDCGTDMTCSTNCRKAFRLPTGQCLPVPTWPNPQYASRLPVTSVAAIFTCPVASSCANLRFYIRGAQGYTNGSCTKTSSYSGHTLNVACNTCHYSPMAGIIRIDCDIITEEVNVVMGCDANCQNCNYTSTGVLTRDVDQCMNGTAANGMQYDIANTGIYACGVIQAKGYTDSSCRQLSATVAFPQSACQWGSIATCNTFLGSPTDMPNNNAAASSPSSVVGPAVGGALGAVFLLILVALFFKMKGKSRTVQQQYHEEPMHAQYQAFMASEGNV